MRGKRFIAGMTAAVLVFGAGAVLNVSDVPGLTVKASAADEKPTSGKCGANVYWELGADGTFTVSGTGDMYDWEFNSSPWYYNTDIKKVVIGSGVTSIGADMFCSCLDLTEVVIPDTVTKISSEAFYDCRALKSVSIPKSVTTIDRWAFYMCSELAQVTIASPETDIQHDAFLGTKWLENKQKENPVVVVNGIVIDGRKCTGDVVIPDGVKRINAFAFTNTNKVTSVTIPKSVKTVGHYSIGYSWSTAYVKDTGVVIKGVKGSAAEKYAQKYDIDFVEYDGSKSDKPDDKPDDNPTDTETKNGGKGDVNLDGEINVTDISMVAAHIKGIKALGGSGLLNADVDKNGEVNVTDIAMIASHIKGIKPLV